jgi:hypothetical protein
MKPAKMMDRLLLIWSRMIVSGCTPIKMTVAVVSSITSLMTARAPLPVPSRLASTSPIGRAIMKDV